MPDTRRSRRLPKPDRRRALALLASAPHGLTEALMIAHGFTAEQMVELITAGLAGAVHERVMAGKTPMQVTRLRITPAGRRALAD